jgi:signal peptidase
MSGWKERTGRGLKIATSAVLIAAGLLGAGRWHGYELMSVQSNSMLPVLKRGDAVLLNKRDTDPRPGDIVSYASPQDPRIVITHRVISVDNKTGMITAKGDSAAAADLPVPGWNVLGTAARSIPYAGFGLDALKHPLGLMAFVYAPAAGIVIAEARRLSRYYSGKAPRRYVLHYYVR